MASSLDSARDDTRLTERQEIFEDHESCILAFLRMELHGKDVVFLHRRGDFLTVLAGCGHRSALARIDHERKAMDKVERRMLL